jgi:hypothetical protein
MKTHNYVLLLLSVTFLSCLTPAIAQEYSSVSGKLENQVSMEAVSYANVSLFRLEDSKLTDAGFSDTTGHFYFSGIPEGNYRLQVNIIGYEEYKKEIVIHSKDNYDAGVIYLKENTYNPGETVVTAERVKGRSEKDKTTYFITAKMTEVSTNGLEVVKLIPGIRVDLRKNISLEGSDNILLLVDGKERDNNFVSQIRADMIDKVEIMSTPPAKYEATVTGVVNVILKKDEKSGTSGQINLEIPASGSLYLHPDYNLSFVYSKLSLFTSYNGELIHFDQQENLDRRITKTDGVIEAGTKQQLEQRLWSHRFHYGFDYSPGKNFQVSVYGYYNPYSQKYEGKAEVTGNLTDTTWMASRASANISRSAFNSVFFKKKFDEKGSTLELDLSNYIFSGKNSDTYIPISDGNETGSLRNESHPEMKATTFKTDLNIAAGENSNLSAGIRLRSQQMEDAKASGFDYTEKTFAAYSSVGVNRAGYEWTLGFRVEKSLSELKNSFSRSYLSLLPSATLNLKLKQDMSLKIAVSRTISRPNLYQLNPYVSFDDPYTMHSGNPLLSPEIRTSAFIEYNRKIGSNFLSTRLFYNRNSDVISNLTRINETPVFETTIFNSGTIHQSGIQLSGTFKAGGMFNFIPYLRLYDNYCEANHLAESYFVKNRNQLVYEPGVSAIAAFKHDINLSMSFQYSSPRNSIQWKSFGDALYFISLEKTFKKSFKASIVSGLPLTKCFIYQGSEASGPEFNSRYEGVVLVRNFMLSFKLNYQFRYGRTGEKINQRGDDAEVPAKGI